MPTKQFPGRARRRTLLVFVCGLFLALAALPAALAQEPEPPVETIPADTEPAPSPDPAPDPPAPEPAPPPPAPEPAESPPPSQPVEPAVSPPVNTPPPAVAEPEPTGPSAEELKRRQRERERKAAERLRKQQEKSVAGGFAAFMATLGQGAVPEVPAEQPSENPPAEQPPKEEQPAAATVNPEPASQPLATPFTDLSPAAQSPLSGAAPILLALLGLAVVLLGLAALPPWSVRSNVLAGLLAQRRLEIGLIGTAVLVSAAIGLAIAVVAD